MNIDNVRVTSANGAQQPPAAPPAPATPPAPQDSVTIGDGKPKATGGMTREEIIRMSGELAAMGRDLKPGDRIVVKVDGQNVAEVTKEGADRWTSFKTMVSDTATSVVRAANSAIQEDPSFTFREAVDVARQRVLKVDLEGLRDVTLKGLVPAARGIALMLDVYRAKKTWENEEAGLIDKLIDGGHVVTDVAGVIGALPEVLPALRAVPGIQGFLMAAVIGDIVAFGYHFLRWFQKTGNRPFPLNPGGKDGQNGGDEQKTQPVPQPTKPSVRVNVGGVETVVPLAVNQVSDAAALRLQAR